MMNWKSFTHGATGISQIPPPRFFGWPLASDASYYYLVLAAAILSIVSALRITNSALGRAMKTVREREIAAQTVGVDLVRMKVLAFMLGAAYAGLGGSLYAHLVTYINPDSFGIMESVIMLVMVLIGGIGSVGGVIIGAILITILPEGLRFIKQYHMLVFGAAVVALMVFMPRGIVGFWHRLISAREN
jgi:branched-chain amino acid transport system permease protein